MSGERITRSQVSKNLLWRFMERTGAQMVGFVVSIVLARILAPEAYGTIAIITVFTTILQVFVDSGLGNALIQKKDADDLDFSTVFYANMFFCIVVYVLLYLAAPAIATFYEDMSLIALIRVLGLTLIISGLKNVQQAYVSKHMEFKKFFFATLGGTIVAAVVGIFMAVLGFGVWALVVQQIINSIIDTIILWIMVKWRPKWMFSFERLKGLFSYGWKLLAASLLDTVYSNLRQLLIGKIYTTSDLAYYNRGKTMPNMIINNINTSIDSVLLPTMSAEQGDVERVKAMTRRAIRISSYTLWPLLIGLMVTAEPVIRLLLTDKWLACVPYLRIFCFTYALYPIHTANLNAIKAMGRSDLFLRLEIIKKVVGLTILVLTINWGVLIMAYSLLFTAVFSSIVNAYPNKQLLHYGYFEQIKDILPSVFLAVIMGVIIYPIQCIGINYVVALFIQVVAGAVIYILMSKLFRIDSFEYVFGMIKEFVSKKRK